MTEEEAKTTMVCPKTLVPLLNAKGHSGPCIGSTCGAWRWLEQTSSGVVQPPFGVQWTSNNNGTFANEPVRPSYLNEQWLWDARRGVWIVGEHFADRGYCGLGGKP